MNYLAKTIKGVGILASSTTESAHTTAVCRDEEGEEYVDAVDAVLHPDAHEDGGLACRDRQLLERQRSAIMDLMKTLAKNLLMGQLDLLKISFPVIMFEPRSYLQKLADPWTFPQLMQNAASARDPVERLRWVVTYILAGYHRAFLKWAKPFNPILGETWQASLLDGTEIYLEQISHHPPISAFQMFGPRGQWQFHGQSQPTVTYRTNTIKTSAKGYRRLEFADGTAIDMLFPHYYIKGLLYTSAPRADVGGTAEFIDRRNHLTAVVHFGQPIEGSSPSSVLSRPDAITGTIYRTQMHGAEEPQPAGMHRSASQPSRGIFSRALSFKHSISSFSLSNAAEHTHGEVKIPVARLTGNWLSHVDWEGRRYWTLVEDQPAEWVESSLPLPSDCRFREDLVKLAAGDIEGAQICKLRLEHRQRADASLRKARDG